MAQSEEMDRRIQVIAWLLVLNRLNAVGWGEEPFGEVALRILQAIGRLVKALGPAAPHP